MNKKIGKNLKYLRANNTNELLKYLVIHGACSRIELSDYMGLSKMTITNIVNNLLENDYIEEVKNDDLQKKITGPKPMILSIKPDRLLAIGVHISRERILCSLTDLATKEIVVKEKRLQHDMLEGKLVNYIISLIQTVLDTYPSLKEWIIGIGVTSVGLVDSVHGILIRSTSFLDYQHVNLKEILEERFSYPVYVKNEIQASALAEQIYGWGRECQHFIYMSITHGIGTSVVSDGKILTGSRGFAVEAGHMSVKYDGKNCSCGNKGCLELYVSLPTLLQKSNSINIQDMMLKYRRREAHVLDVIKEFIQILSIALINLSNIFDSERIIIGHEGALLDQSIFEAIEWEVNHSCIWSRDKKVKICPSNLYLLGPLRGAVAVVFEKLFEGNITLK